MEAPSNQAARTKSDTEPKRSPSARGRRIGTALGTLAAMYVAFAVGAPWLLHDAPPDSYAVVASKAACAHDSHGTPCRETRPH